MSLYQPLPLRVGSQVRAVDGLHDVGHIPSRNPGPSDD